MKKIIQIVISLVMLSLIAYFANNSYKSAKELEKVNKEYYQAQMDIEEILKRKLEGIVSTLTLGLIKSEESKKVDLDKLRAKRLVLKEKNNKYTLYLAITVGVSLLLYFILDLDIFALFLAFTSLITLIYGIITPILMIVIHKNVNFLGDIVLSFESKTIIGTISHLYHNANYPIAIAILIFSVVVPFIKTLSMIAVVLSKDFNIAKKIVSFFKHLGKWSMLDVFIVALLLVYLSAGSSENSYSEVESGIYIFLIYVIVSILTSISVDKLLEKAK